MVLNVPPVVTTHTQSRNTPSSMANSNYRGTRLPQSAPTVEMTQLGMSVDIGTKQV